MGSPQNAGILIVGSGLAGYSLAREFRKLNQETPVTVITADGGESYSKPMLSNALSQNKSDESLVQKTAEQMQADLSIQVRSRCLVLAINRAEKTVTLQDQTRLSYDRLVLALGATARPSGFGDKFYSVNDLNDFRVWRGKLGRPQRILLQGAGLVGCEFANDLTSAGHSVAMVDPALWPLGRLLPQQVGQQLAKALQDTGVHLHLNRTVSEMSDNEAVLSDGSRVPFDLALSAIGLLPRTTLASESGLAVDRGIVVDRSLRTSDPDIYAMGDCAQSPAGILPFVLPLMAQARTLAEILAGRAVQLKLPALPVVVKTPCLPLAVCPPAAAAQGDWRIEGEGRDLKALFIGKDGTALGFALSGSRAAERQILGKTMPDLI